ncbi:Lon protease [Rubripirellula obstinata]|uniref:Lon protease n=1 Tax=Rubripirellula obstinata TaxID=406547 RepID=A0A5B1CHL6_9BACT|nr:LON peptidase substrate-binding domain-containing protein [Rubripirellula obstinata]KAA1259060.1 Lon protease [Rubripirellula obstinata]
MDNLDDVTRLPEDFDSKVRLFPLPDLVVFPHAMQPLHILEPRYCEMLADSLSTDRLVAMATLTGGIATVPQSGPPVASTVCLGRIVSHAEVESEKHNILLVGIRRAKIVQELDTGRPFRIAEVEVDQDFYSPTGANGRLKLKQELLNEFANIIPPTANVQQNLHELMAGQMGLGPITDIISYTLPFDVESKLQLLAQPNVDDRAEALIELLKSGKIQLHSVSVEEQAMSGPTGLKSSFKNAGGKSDQFPPPFSLN